jgi:hypothetical protein
MDIRKLMDLLENIEKKDTIEPPEEKDEEDNEVDTDVNKNKDSDTDIDDEEKKKDKNDEKDKDYSEFKKYAGDLGDDLYTMSLYDYGHIVDNDFIDKNLNDRLDNIIRQTKDSVANKFRHSVGTLDIDDKTIAALILNDRNGKFFVYSSGKSGHGFDPGTDISGLIDKDIIDVDQSGKLEDIGNSGKRYHALLKKIRWTSGESASNSGVYSAAHSLIDSMNLPGMPEDIKLPTLSPEQVAKNKEKYKGLKQKLASRLSAKNNKDSTTDIGREKR